MLKKSAGSVLASFRSSTYPRGYASALHSLRPCRTSFLSILRECSPVRGKGSRTNLHPQWRFGLPSSVLLAESDARFETNVSRLTCVSKSDTTQKLERQRVDGNGQRLHRPVGQLILAKPAQQQIHTRASTAQNFSFAVVRHEGECQPYTR